jgi:23S rRNA (uracil1939-C5)-methyltransferase
VDYPREVLIKQQQLESSLRHIPHDSAIFHPPVASPQSLHYRNKITLHAETTPSGMMKLGYREEPSHRVIDIPSCPLAHPAINEALHTLRASGELKNMLKQGDDLIFRHTLHDGVIWRSSTGVTSPGYPACLTVQSSIGNLKVPHNGFYQVNPSIAGQLLDFTAKRFGERSDCPEILDLYCGVGVFGLTCMKQGGRYLTGVEAGRAAITVAQENAALHDIPARFHVHALGLQPIHVQDWIKHPTQTTLIINPPREGMDKHIAESISQSDIPRIFYISCDPATLTRDLKIILSTGKRQIRHVRLFDMFPRTARFETFVELCSID